MPYVPPTATTFKARYPEFAPVSDILVNLVLAEAIDAVGETWLERDRAKAQMYLAAHTLAMEGEPSRTTTGQGTGTTGPVKRFTVGDVTTEFAGAGASSGGATGGSGYLQTNYGRMYLESLRKNFPAVAVV